MTDRPVHGLLGTDTTNVRELHASPTGRDEWRLPSRQDEENRRWAGGTPPSWYVPYEEIEERRRKYDAIIRRNGLLRVRVWRRQYTWKTLRYGADYWGEW